MLPRPLLSGLAWRAAVILAAVLLILAMLYTAAQLVGAFNTGIRFA